MAKEAVWMTNPDVPQAFAASGVLTPSRARISCPINRRAELGIPNDVPGFRLNDMPSAIKRTARTSSSHLSNVERPLDGTFIAVGHLGDCTPEHSPYVRLVVEECPEDCSPHRRSVPR